MTVITTKQLRENMQQVIRNLRQGKSVQLSYRHSVIGVLQPVEPVHGALRRGSPEAIRRSLQSLHDALASYAVKDDKRSIKEQITELRDRKYYNK